MSSLAQKGGPASVNALARSASTTTHHALASVGSAASHGRRGAHRVTCALWSWTTRASLKSTEAINVAFAVGHHLFAGGWIATMTTEQDWHAGCSAPPAIVRLRRSWARRSGYTQRLRTCLGTRNDRRSK